MSQPISLDSQPNHRNGNHSNEARDEHAQAVMAARELLQALHDRGILNLLRGLVEAGDELIGTLAAATNTPDGTRALRNFILLTKFFANIRPELLHGLVDTVLADTDRARQQEPPGVLALLGRMRSEESRRGLALTLDLLESLGRGA